MKRIALVLGLSDHYDHGIAGGVIRFAKERADWQLFGHGWMFSHLDDLGEWEGDGVIARVARRDDADRLACLDLPVVDVAGAFPEYRFRQVTNDDVATGSTAGRYLAARGLEHWAYCGVEGVAWSDRRQEGFERSIAGSRGRRSGADPQVAVFRMPLDWWEQPGDLTGLVEFLRLLRRPAGLFAANDSVALRVLQSCRTAGIAVPDELAVVGVDNEDITCEIAQPSLTSISLRLQSIGYRAAGELAALLSDQPLPGGGLGTEGTAVAVPPGDLVERESSRIFPTEDPIVRTALEAVHRLATRGATVGDIASAVPLSRRSLEIRFRRETGRTIHQSLTEVRLAHAASLLRSTNRKIQAVAADSGIRSLQRFFELFRGTYGMTPAAYRARSGDEGTEKPASAGKQTGASQSAN